MVSGLVPCGKCILCKRKESRSWALRSFHESLSFDTSYFATLTYDDLHLPSNSSLVKSHLQKFIKKLRDRNEKIRYFACGEYGSKTNRPHYHALLFGLRRVDLVQKNWDYGFTQSRPLSVASTIYTAGYIFKKYASDEDYGSRQIPFRLMSRRYGLGNSWIKDKVNAEATSRLGFCKLGKKTVPIPRYYKDLIYDEVDKQDIRDTYEEEKWIAINRYMSREKITYPKFLDLWTQSRQNEAYNLKSFIKNQASSIV